jgi:hypothetical protein
MAPEDDLRTQLDELERTLSELRAELDETPSRRDTQRRRRPRPPTPLELLRLTESHTLPTLVATLEATIEALELFRALLRVVDPAARDRPTAVPSGARTAVGRALSELQSTLDGADVPDDPAARDLVTEARDLAADVESRLEASRRGTADPSSGAGVAIDVDDEADAATGDDRATDVDVESELDSIRDDIRDEDGSQ